jgi:DNA-binding SARP family transcriptional activator
VAAGRPGLEVRLLGPVEARRGGAPLALGGGRQRALLAALALRRGQVVSTDRLIDELWGEQPPETAATALHGLVSQLRRALELDRAHPTVVVTRPPGYVLALEPDDVDAERFERLAAVGAERLESGQPDEARRALADALALWAGPALAGVEQPFARAEAHRLDELRLHAQEERIEADLGLGHAAAVVPELEALIEREPLRERPRAQLMRALYASGRQAEALDAYRDARARLHDELGIEPGPELRDLERRILSQDPALASASWLQRARVRRVRRRALVLGVLGAVLVAAGIGTAFLVRGDEPAAVVARANSVAVLDPGSNRIVEAIPVGAQPTAVVVGHGSVWVANTADGTVSRIDEQSHEVVSSVGVGAPASSLAVSDDAVWVGNGSAGTVSRIDAATNAVDTMDVSLRPGDILKDTVYGIQFVAGSVWVGVGRAVLRLDPRTGDRQARIDLDGVPLALAAGDDALWIAAGDERLIRIDPSTNRPAASAEIAFPTDAAAGAEGVWVTQGNFQRAAISAFDAVSLAPRGLVELGAGTPSNVYPAALALGEGAVWVAEVRFGPPSEVLRFAPSGGGHEPVRIPLAAEPTDVAVGADRVWVTLRVAPS